jgi:predicted nuclease of predicted toxin-antitoxin system
MPLHFFADQCVPTEIVEALTRESHRVTLLRRALPQNSPDRLVIQEAQTLDTILLSLNGDFADIVEYPPGRYKGIVAIQLKNHPESIPLLMELFIKFLTEHQDEAFYQGKLFIVEPHRIRIRI